MSDVLKAFMQSNVWDNRYGLPLLPDHNNPWIYGAYALKIMKSYADFESEELSLRNQFMEYAGKCFVEPGLYHRWPDGFGGVTSQDEIIGMGYVLSRERAIEILNYLDTHDGDYNNTNTVSIIPGRFNLYRFYQLRPYLAACAGVNLNPLSQLLWIIHVLVNAFKENKEGNWDTKLMIWLMGDKMDKFIFCSLAYKFWKFRMRKIPFSKMFSTELKNYPVYAEWVVDE